MTGNHDPRSGSRSYAKLREASPIKILFYNIYRLVVKKMNENVSFAYFESFARFRPFLSNYIKINFRKMENIQPALIAPPMNNSKPAADYRPAENLLKIPKRVTHGGVYDPWSCFRVMADDSWPEWAICTTCLRNSQPNVWIHRVRGATTNLNDHMAKFHSELGAKRKVFFAFSLF
jgi:hypothetical protein